MGSFAGKAFHTSRWDYAFTGEQLQHLRGKRVGVIGTGATAVQLVPELAAAVVAQPAVAGVGAGGGGSGGGGGGGGECGGECGGDGTGGGALFVFQRTPSRSAGWNALQGGT